MSLKAFRKIQISNPENTVGTAEAATEIVYGVIVPPGPGFEVHWPEEDRNSLARHMANDEIVSKMQQLTWTGDLNHRLANYLLAMAIRGNVTPTQPDPTNEPLSYLWTYAPGLTTANTPDIDNGIDTFTIEYGDNTQAYETAFCFIERLTIEGAANGMCTFTAEIVGDTQTDTTFTAGLTAQTVQRFPFNLATFAIDTTWANLGNTAKTGVLRGFTWTLDTMFRAFHTADGALDYSAVTEGQKAPTLVLRMARGATSDAERTKHESRSTTYIRIKLNGQTEMDASQSNPPYLIIDGAYRYETWPELGEDEGRSIEAPTAVGVYDATGAKMFQLALLTNVSAWPT